VSSSTHDFLGTACSLRLLLLLVWTILSLLTYT
jgi:hypothetical protein